MRAVAILLLCFFAATLRAASDAGVRELGDGLGYLRIKELDTAGLPSAPRPLVIDLRRTTFAAPAALEKLSALLTASGAPRFVLIGETTPPDLVALLDARAPNVLTLGASSPALHPDIGVSATPDEDRRAYEAVEQGLTLDAVVRPPVEKTRLDEAAIVRERNHGGAIDATAPAADDGNLSTPPAATPGAPSTTPADGQAGAKPAPPVDAVLQRAVQVYQALKALRKI